MRLDLDRFARQLCGRSRVCGLACFGIHVVNRDMRIGNRRLLEIFVDAATAAYKPSLQFDGHARSASEIVMMMRLLVNSRIMRYPLDAVIGDVFVPLFAGGDVFAISLAVDDLRLVPPGIDLNLEIVR